MGGSQARRAASRRGAPARGRATGALLLAGAWQLRGIGGASLMALNGTLSLVLGLLIAVDLPSSADWAIGLLVGINLLFWGIRALVAAAALQRAYEE
jgi:uncharacterized membrane protein HdeD (DUF308 family)